MIRPHRTVITLVRSKQSNVAEVEGSEGLSDDER